MLEIGNKDIQQSNSLWSQQTELWMHESGTN